MTSRERPHKPRRPWLAFLLGILAPGLGHVYAGAAARALIAFVITIGVLGPIARVIQLPIARSFAGVVVGLLVAIGIFLLVPFDAARTARRRREEPMRPWNRVWVYVAYWAVFSLLTSFGVQWVFDRLPVRAFRIPSGSMADTVLLGDTILADMRTSRLEPIERGDLVVHEHPGEPVLMIKRVIGLPGEVVELRDGRLVVDGVELAEPYVRPEYRERDPKRNTGPLTVRPGHYFLLGDRRDQSADSRFFGQIPRALLKGKVRQVWWSFEESRPFRPYEPEDMMQRIRDWLSTSPEMRWNRVGLVLETPGYRVVPSSSAETDGRPDGP